MVLAGAIGTIFQVLGPKLLGMATTKVFEGFVAKTAGIPGAAIDFQYVGRLLLGLAGLYVLGNGFQYLMRLERLRAGSSGPGGGGALAPDDTVFAYVEGEDGDGEAQAAVRKLRAAYTPK